MFKKRSIYKCPCCDAESKSNPGKRVVCQKCRVVMVEEVKGMIKK